MGRGARLLLAAFVAGVLTCAWWLASSAPEPGPAATPTGLATAPAGSAAVEPGAVSAPAEGPLRKETTAADRLLGEMLPAVRLTVIDELELPLAGARVRLLADTSAGDDLQAAEWITDEHGRVELPGAPRLRLAADKPGYVHVERAVRVRLWDAGGSPVFLKLQRAIPLSGLVTDRTSGQPIAGALVSSGHRSCDACPPDLALSDGTGRYRFESVPVGGRLDLSIEAEGYVAARSRFRTELEALAAVHDVQLGRGLPLLISVLDAETRAPIQGAEVWGAKGPLVSDAYGRIESDQLVELDEGRGKLTFAAPGYCQLTLRPTVGAIAAAPELLAPLVRAVTVEGRVLDSGGSPAESVLVNWDPRFAWTETTAPQPLASWLEGLPKWSLGSERKSTRAELSSLAEGRFTLHGAVPWTPAFTLTASAPDGQRGDAELTLPGPGATAQVLIELHTGALASDTATIRGRFTLNGDPEPGSVHWRGATREGSARPDKHGAFELSGVEPGAVEMFVRSDRVLARSTCTLADMGPFAVYLAPGANLVHDLALALPFAAIEGRVSDTSGAPVADLPVEAEDPGRCWRERARTDPEGRYRLEVPQDLPAFEVSVERTPERLTQSGVRPGADGVDFVLAELGRLRFRALDESDGSSITRGQLDCRRPGAPFRELADFARLVPDPAGWYEFECPAGTLDLSIATSREQHVPQQMRSVVVYPDETTTVEFLLRQSLTRLLVLDNESIPLPDDFAAVLVPDALWSKARFIPEPSPHWEGLGKHGPFDELLFKAGGTARARGLKPGAYRIKVWPETLRMTPDRLKLKAGEVESTVHVRLDWR